jgi:hypothetical protein
MSWQGRAGLHRRASSRSDTSTAYVDTNLVGTKAVTEAAILGKAGGVWATSAKLTVCYRLS